MNSSEIERAMIHQDMRFCLGVGECNPELSLQLFPYICLIVLESCQYFEIVVDDVHLKNIRAKAKQLDDTRLDIPKSIDLLESIHSDHNKYYQSLHRGRFKWFKQLLQKDLGEYRYKERFLSTTLLNNYLISLSSRNTEIEELLGGKAFDVGHSVGLLVGAMLRERKIRVEYPAEHIILLQEEIHSTDYKSKRYFQKRFSGELAPELVHLFQLYYSMLNFSYYILTPENVNEFTLFKIRFITYYHFVSSMKKLQSYFHLNGLGSERNRKYFISICSDSFSKNILTNKKFRNILVHYKLPDRDVGLDLNNLVEGLAFNAYRGIDSSELKEILNEKIQYSIGILDNLMLRA